MLTDTKEKILQTALELFAQKGYLGTSMSDIAEKLEITKGALYKHYDSKQAIFDKIIERMEAGDTQQEEEYSMPLEEEQFAVTLSQLADFALAQFEYWTKDAFASAFRRMLTVEQYRSAEMQKLYQQYLGAGQLAYVEDLFSTMGIVNANERALEFFSPLYLCYSLSDLGGNEEVLREKLIAHFEGFITENS